MAAECNFTKSNGLYHSHDVLQVQRKVVASVCTCCPSSEETEEGQLSQDVRYSETDKEDLFLHALKNIWKLETDKNAFKCHLADLMNGFLTELVKRQDKMKDRINTSTYMGATIQSGSSKERKRRSKRSERRNETVNERFSINFSS